MDYFIYVSNHISFMTSFFIPLYFVVLCYFLLWLHTYIYIYKYIYIYISTPTAHAAHPPLR